MSKQNCPKCLSKKVKKREEEEGDVLIVVKNWSLPKNVTKKLRKSAEQWVLDRSTLRRIEERTDICFSTKWKQVQKYADLINSPLERDFSKASKILLLDTTLSY